MRWNSALPRNARHRRSEPVTVRLVLIYAGLGLAAAVLLVSLVAMLLHDTAPGWCA